MQPGSSGMDSRMSQASGDPSSGQQSGRGSRRSSAASVAAAEPPAAHIVTTSPTVLSGRAESVFLLGEEAFFSFNDVRVWMRGSRNSVESKVFMACFGAKPADAVKSTWTPDAGTERFLRVYVPEGGGTRLLLLSRRALERWFGWARIPLTDAGYVKYDALLSAALAHLAAAAAQSPLPTSQPGAPAEALGGGLGGATPATRRRGARPAGAGGEADSGGPPSPIPMAEAFGDCEDMGPEKFEELCAVIGKKLGNALYAANREFHGSASAAHVKSRVARLNDTPTSLDELASQSPDMRALVSLVRATASGTQRAKRDKEREAIEAEVVAGRGNLTVVCELLAAVLERAPPWLEMESLGSLLYVSKSSLTTTLTSSRD